MDYDLELDRVVSEIKKANAKLVCIQLPAGLKPKAAEIQEEIEKKTGADVVIWGGSCFGSCDTAFQVSRMGVDLLVHWGHAEWR